MFGILLETKVGSKRTFAKAYAPFLLRLVFVGSLGFVLKFMHNELNDKLDML